MASKITDTVLAGITAVGSLVASIFLSPPKYVWGISGLVIAAAGLGMILKNRWVEGNPNEWLIVIRNGKMLKAGVGLKTFIGLNDTVVKFPSKIEKVQFNAQNVTKQMQGVAITGFAFWSVYRQEDGPFRCYKYMQGGDANSSVQAMCQSVLRNLIANSSLNQVLTNRNHLRDNIKKDLIDQFKGWGVWLETVEITEVKISSERLFTDLQAEFRQDTRLKAEKIDLSTREQLTKQRNESEMKMAQIEQLNNTKKQQTRNNQQLKRANQQSQYDLKKNQLQIQRLQRQKQLSLQRLKNDFQQQQQRINNQNKIKIMKQQYQIQFQKKCLQVDKMKMEVDRLHDSKTLQKYQIDTMERIYNKVGVREIKINQYTGGEQTNLASILPGLGFAMSQMKPVE